MKTGILLLGMMAAGAEGAQEWPVRIESPHYEMKSTAAEAQSLDLLNFMETVFETYLALLKPDDPKEVERRKFTILLYRDREEFLRSGAPEGAGAFYNGKELVGYYHPTLTKPFFAHEGMHQFTDVTSKNFRDFPMWFTEGIADCVGNSEIRNGKLTMCVKSGMIARMRLPLIQYAIREGKAYPMSELLSLDRRRFMQNADLCYAQSWSFCHFLMTYPEEEERSKQIPNGRFRKNLAVYYERMRMGGTTHAKAWAEAFEGIPLEELEKGWKKYVVEKLDAGRFLGFNGEEISAEAAKSLGLEEGFTGIRVERVVKEGAAEGAGMKPEDVIVKFNGKRFKAGEAMETLRIELQNIPLGRSAKVVVVREGKETELTATWRAK